jgi:CHAD domain-containing protein
MTSMAEEPKELLAEVVDERFGQLAYQALEKYFRQATRYQPDVLKDRDPEDVHQMRVGLRRLRTTLLAYGSVVRLPKHADEPSVKNLAKALGQVRDSDVLIQKLEQDYRPSVPHSEQTALDTVIKRQRKRRKRYFKHLRSVLTGKPYRQFESAYQQWFNDPSYTALAAFAVNHVAADVLLPLLSRVLLHPSWLACQTVVQEEMSSTRLHHWLSQDGAVLHDLRKQVKLLRYQVEFLSKAHGNALDFLVVQLKDTQELLGQLQDLWVLNHVLDGAIGRRWMTTMPILAQVMSDEEVKLWALWQPTLGKFLSPTYRSHLRRTLAIL